MGIEIEEAGRCGCLFSIRQEGINMLLVLSLCFLLIGSQIFAVPLSSDSGGDFLRAIYDDVQRVKNGTSAGHVGAGCSACYDELGCFDRCTGTFHYIGELPYSPGKISTAFTLYTR